MQIIRADALGMCFGVKDALKIADRVEQPRDVAIHGELVHNPLVNESLRARGFRQQSEAGRAAAAPAPLVLITAHGVSDRERARLQAQGAALIDTTCPLVRRAHRAALALANQGYFVVVLGKSGHVEVEGLTGDLDACAVVHDESDVGVYEAARIGVVCQTTMPPDQAATLRAEIVRQNPQAAEVRFVDTICRPTKERQQALERLLDGVDAVVVVGGRRSNNTRALLERCHARGVAAWQVERADELKSAWFDGKDRVGVTAGTSTLDGTIDAVERRLREIATPALPRRAVLAPI